MDTIKLWGKTPLFDADIKDQKEPSLTPFIVKQSKATVIVCPGGGYTMKAVEHEGIAIANWLNSIGVSAFVLDYRVTPYKAPCPLMDAKRAIRYLRNNADKYSINKDKIGIMGFSAGGHLACSASVHFEDCENPIDEIDKESSRPDFTILAYPVISSEKSMTHKGSFANLLGNKLSDVELLNYYSLEKNVTPQTPPMFIWHTAEDDGVSVENSLELLRALTINKVYSELHVFPNGAHGLGLADGNNCRLVPHVAQWSKLCEKWLEYILK